MLPEGVEGLIHISDLSWTQRVQNVSEILKVGQEVEAVILDVKVDAEKVSLSLKHTQPDPFSSYKNGQVVTGKVTQVNDRGVTLDLGAGIEANIRESELSEDAEGEPVKPEIGAEIVGKISRVDVKERRLEVSVRRYDREEEKRMLKRYSGQNQEPLRLGDVLLDANSDTEEPTA